MTETKLDTEMKIMSIPGFTITRSDRTGGGGGVAVLYRCNFNCKQIQLKEMDLQDSKIEILTVKVQVSKRKSFLISCLYRPKFVLTINDIDKLESIFLAHMKTNLTFYICGDFNIHLEQAQKSHIRKFNQVLDRHDLIELVQTSTRGKARLDLIISNDKKFVTRTMVEQPHISDHESTIIDRVLIREPRKMQTISFRAYNKMDTGTLGEEVVSMNFDGMDLLTVSEACQIFTHKHIELFNKFAPILTKTIRATTAPRYMSDDTKLLTVCRDKLYLHHKNNPTHLTKTRLKILNSHIKEGFKRDCKRKIDSEIDKNGIWKTKKHLFTQNNKGTAFDSDLLNDFYAGVSNEEIDCLCPPKPHGLCHSAQFTFSSISIDKMIKLYKKLKTRSRTSHDSTGLAPIMLHYTIGCPSISEAITNLVNMSLVHGEFPSSLKTGIITPIPKITSPTEPAHFRPVAVQPFLSLLIEKCAHSQVVEYLNKNSMFYKGQFGFRNKHSCETAMIAITESIYEQVNKGHICILVALDLSRAFDVIVREFLLEKLKWYGIDPKWFRSYLSYRAQVVKGADGKVSGVRFTVNGCPQGSVMGSLVFCVYINDLPLVVRHCLLVLFADDSQLVVSGHPDRLIDIMDKMKTDLTAVIDWMKRNGMKLNLGKTQMIVFGSAANLAKVGRVTIEIDGVKIVSSDQIKSLGLTLDSKLSWYNHINALSRKFHFIARSIYPLKPLMSQKNLILIFNACLISLFNYMVVVWGSSSKKNLNIIEKGVRRVARFILGRKSHEPIRDLIRDRLKWFFPKQNYYFKSLCFLHSLQNCDIPFFDDFIKKSMSFHNYPTRSASNLRSNFCPQNTISERSIHFHPVIAWNKLSDDVKNCKDGKTFRIKLRSHILSNDHLLPC